MEQAFLDLNKKQQRAAEAGEGPVLIVAGPGTGKTKTLVARIMYLITNRKVRPERILALTFTKKAAEEMSSRVTPHIMGGKPRIATFHALCYDLLDSNLPFVGEAERLQIIKSLPRPKALKDLSVRELALLVSRAKNAVTIDDPDVAKVVRAYNKTLAGQSLRDFDDLLLQTYERLQGDAAFRQDVESRYQYILVDEFQDTNRLQYEILKLLGTKNVFVIGDPLQSIYGFRGAGSGIFDAFKTDFPGATEITLTTNYRSVPQVVRLSNTIFPGTVALDAHSQHPGRVRAVEVLNEYAEARWVLGEIQRAIGGGDFLKAVSDDERATHRRLSDFAVLYRSRPAAAVFQKVLAESGLPYQVVGDGSPYDRPEIQAVITLMRSSVSGAPIVLEGYTSAEQRFLQDELTKAPLAKPSALAERIISILGIEADRDLQQFVGTLVRFRDVPAAIAYFESIAEHGFYDPSADAITLLTIHASKGLEFPNVFLIGAEEGILPSGRGDESEERRIFYVAATRARERLEITHARNRGGQQSELSRFIRQLPASALERHTDPGMADQLRRIAKRAAKNSQTSLF